MTNVKVEVPRRFLQSSTECCYVLDCTCLQVHVIKLDSSLIKKFLSYSYTIWYISSFKNVLIVQFGFILYYIQTFHINLVNVICIFLRTKHVDTIWSTEIFVLYKRDNILRVSPIYCCVDNTLSDFVFRHCLENEKLQFCWIVQTIKKISMLNVYLIIIHFKGFNPRQATVTHQKWQKVLIWSVFFYITKWKKKKYVSLACTIVYLLFPMPFLFSIY